MSEATRNAISSQEAGCGPSQLDLLDGLTTPHSGRDHAPVSHSRRRGKASEPMIQGICGRTFIASSVHAGPLSSWESRLRERLAMVGSTEFALIWREKTSPQGQSISRLAVSTRHTNGTGSIGSQWSTPRASDGEKGGPNQSFGAGGQPLPSQMHQAERAFWPVMLASDVQKQSENPETGRRRMGKGQQIGLNTFMAMTAESSRQMVQEPQATWPTVQTNLSYQEDPAKHDARKTRMQERHGRYQGENLPTLMGSVQRCATEPIGQTPSGSNAMTEKRGAPNPVFAFWLMGFPVEWISGALAAMRSYRKPRRK